MTILAAAYSSLNLWLKCGRSLAQCYSKAVFCEFLPPKQNVRCVHHLSHDFLMTLSSCPPQRCGTPFWVPRDQISPRATCDPGVRCTELRPLAVSLGNFPGDPTGQGWLDAVFSPPREGTLRPGLHAARPDPEHAATDPAGTCWPVVRDAAPASLEPPSPASSPQCEPEG